jgi:enamine deaminase RidA (YjgF/YER057c/UK114 family)
MRVNLASGSPYEAEFGYCRAVRVGDTVHVAGTCAQPPHIDGADAYEQATSAISVISAALDEAGASVADVVRTITYVTDMADKDLVAKAHRETFGEVRPAATLVEVSSLIDPAMVVEIEAYAIINNDH